MSEGVKKAGVKVGARGDINFIEGSNITLTIDDDTDADNDIDITIASSGGAGGHTIAEAGSALTARTTLNFGAGFDVADDAIGDETDVTLDLSEVAGSGDITWTGNTPAVDNDSHAHTSTTVTTHSTAHAASAVTVDSTTLVGTGTDVQAVFEELDNGIVDHAAAADPHTGYRLESADHTHATTGAQAGQLDHGLALTGLTDDDHTQYRLETDRFPLTTFTKTGTITTGTGVTRWYNDSGRTLTFAEWTAAVGTAPTGASIIVDVNVGGTTIMTGTKVVIAISAFVGSQTTFSTTTVADGGYITVDIDQVGSTIAGADLTITGWATA